MGHSFINNETDHLLGISFVLNINIIYPVEIWFNYHWTNFMLSLCIQKPINNIKPINCCIVVVAFTKFLKFKLSNSH